MEINAKPVNLLTTCLLIVMSVPLFAQEDITIGEYPPAGRDMPSYWQSTRFNLRWAGSAANFMYITRYIAEGMLERIGEDRDTGYITYGTRGRSTSVNITAVGNHEVDFGVTTPPVNAILARAGMAYFDKAYTDLRAIAVYGQDDKLLCLADAGSDITSFDQIRENQLPVRIATNAIGDDNGVSFLVEQIFRAHGITPDDIHRWGGEFIDAYGSASIRKVIDGEADIGCNEAWKRFFNLAETKDVNVLPVSDAAMQFLEEEFGYKRNVVAKDTFGLGQPAEDVQVVDYSDWLVITNANLPDWLAYMAAKVAVEDRESYEVLYLGETEFERSADIPLDPIEMWKNVGIPLHPGAARYYREAGLMP